MIVSVTSVWILNKTGNVTLWRVRKNSCCRVKAISITYFYVCACVRGCMQVARRVYARVAFFIQHATRMRHIVLCGLSSSTTFFDIIS